MRENKTAAVPIFSPEEFTDFQDFYTKKLEGAWVMTGKRFIIPMERIENRIYLLRGHKIMLSTDLAELYGVEPRVLVQAVKRNIERFPEDFMFQLSKEEFDNLKSQIVTSSWGGLRRAAPYAFTEQGVAMLSGVLNSKRAVSVNIEIMRAFEVCKVEHKVLAKALRYGYNVIVNGICPPLNQLSHESARCPQRGFVFPGGEHAR